jgi:hypothetical protein
VSDRQLAKELQARNVVAERIAAVLVQRRKIGAERRIHEWEYQQRNNQRAIVRYYRLNGEAVAHKGTAQQGQPKSSASLPVRDIHANKVAEPVVQPYITYFRWNSVNGSTV